ncbi:MAG TPA: long-chain-fatty-acid--CoA ligase [Sphingobium sp.]|uniref:long-chain-fatty-acid--CoA ligase n=1 Tax=Sphingobium sp. TaxID=1912891 RepID=UPI002ED15451
MSLKFAHGSAESYPYPLLIGKMLSGLSQHPDQQIISNGKAFTYASLERRIGLLAAGLSSIGVDQGTTVAVMNWDDHRYLECYFAIPMMGAVLQTVNVRLSPAQILYTLRDSGAEVIFYHPDFQDLIDTLSVDLPALRTKILLADGADKLCYEALLSSQSATFAFEDFDENALATTFHTTGTTGDPKAVAFSHRQIVLHTFAVAVALANQPEGQGFGINDVYMPMTPMFHVHAWGIPYIATMLGVKQVYPSRYDAARLIALQEEHGVSFSHCVPTIIQMLLDELQDGRVRSPWKMLVGGSALSPALAARARDKNILTVAGYGMSETGPVVSIARTHSGEPTEGACRAGFPIPLVQTRTRDQGHSELEVRAPWLTQAYVGDEDASTTLWAGGWLHTQDIAEYDPDGGIRIVDRLKDVIKTGGEWVSSSVLEEYTMRHPSVLEAAFVGIPNDQWGERPVVMIVLRHGHEAATLKRIRDHLARFVTEGLLSRYALPDAIVTVASIPKTSVGKIDKKAIRTLMSQGMPNNS